MTPKQAKTLETRLKKAEWILSKPVIGGSDRARLEAIVRRIRLALEPEDPDKVAADATTIINTIAQCGPLREARV